MAYALAGTKPWVAAAGNLLGPMFGITTIYGVRPDPIWGHPQGFALDFMTPSKAAGDALAEYAKNNAARLGVTQVIWYTRIFTVARASEGWRRYTGTSNPHTDHVHLTFSENAPSGGLPAGVTQLGFGGSTPVVDLVPEWMKKLNEAFASLTAREFWVRYGIGFAGALLIVLGVARMIGLSANQVVNKVVS